METFIILVVVVVAIVALIRYADARRRKSAPMQPPVPVMRAAESDTPHHGQVAEDPDGLDIKWLGPLTKAGFTPSLADFTWVAEGGVMAAARGMHFARSMPFVNAPDAALVIQGDRIGLAIPDAKEIKVISRDLADARLMVSRFQALQVVFGNDATIDGWTFTSVKVDTTEGREVGDTLRQWIRG